MKYFTSINSGKSSSILGRARSAKVPFFVAIAGATAGSKDFNFLKSMHKWN